MAKRIKPSLVEYKIEKKPWSTGIESHFNIAATTFGGDTIHLKISEHGRYYGGGITISGWHLDQLNEIYNTYKKEFVND